MMIEEFSLLKYQTWKIVIFCKIWIRVIKQSTINSRGVFDQTRDLFGQIFGLGLHRVSFVKLKF